MPLVFDERARVGEAPGVHALIAGVSDYTHLPGGAGPPADKSFGMQQLSSAALSAYRIYEWLIARKDRLPAPLASVRLLLAATPPEVAAEPALAEITGSCTLSEFKSDAGAWRADARTHRESTTVFYFAGHGVQRTKGDAVLLLQDFGAPGTTILEKAVNTKNIQNGMAPSPSQPEIARTQLYFVDACRMLPEAFRDYEQLDTSPVFDPEVGGEDDRRTPTYFAAVPGAVAYARPGVQTLFSEALLACLNGGAAELEEVEGEDRWTVTHFSLGDKLAERVREIAADAGAVQWIRSDGFGTNAPLHYLDGPPRVDVELEVVPSGALEWARVAILDDSGAPAAELPTPLAPNPYATTLPAGVYAVRAAIDPPTDPYIPFTGPPRPVMPPRARKVIKLG
jgi:Caspase domain